MIINPEERKRRHKQSLLRKRQRESRKKILLEFDTSFCVKQLTRLAAKLQSSVVHVQEAWWNAYGCYDARTDSTIERRQ